MVFVAVAVVQMTAPTVLLSQTGDTSPIIDLTQATRLRGIADMSADWLLQLAKTGRAQWYDVEATDERSLRSILSKVCGDQPASVQAYLERRTPELNGVASLDHVVKAGLSAAVPYCLLVRTNVPVVVQKGDTPERILRREYGVYGPKTQRTFFELNAGQTYSTSQQFEQGLQVGNYVAVPYQAPSRTYVPNSNEEGQASSRVLVSLPPNFRTQQETSARPEPGPHDFSYVPDPNDLSYVPSVELASTENCAADDGAIAPIVDASQLKTRFAEEAAAREKYFRLDPNGQKLVPTTVGIIDTGLREVGDDFFDESFFKINIDEKQGGNDQNGYKGDVYGYSFYKGSGDITPILGDENSAHGTKMAALILGGMNLAREFNLSHTPPLVRIRVVNFSSNKNKSGKSTIGAEFIKLAIDYLAKGSYASDIINLSVITKSQPLVLMQVIDSYSNTVLIVAAAGNNKNGEGFDLGDEPRYPARYGGADRPNVVTVAAHNLAKRRAYFTFYSKIYVDLLAPGCSVETRTDLGAKVLDHGSSPATAIVSFAAGLVHSLGVTDPFRIKQRLLIGTDYDPLLVETAFSGGRLNILKAIAIYHDLVEDKEGNLLFGRIKNPRDLLDACDLKASAFDVSSMIKFIPDLGDVPGQVDKHKVGYWLAHPDSTKIDMRACKKREVTPKITIEIEKLSGNDSVRRDLTDIKEIIFATHIGRMQ